MPNLRSSIVVVLAAAFSLLPTAVRAQSSDGGVELSIGYHLWSGDAVEELDGAIRGQLTGFRSLTPRVATGLAVFYGQGGVDGFPEDVREFGAGGVLRLSSGEPGTTHLVLDGMLAWSRLTVSSGPVAAFQEDGIVAGSTLGLSIPVGEGIQLVIAGDVAYHRYSEVHFEEGPPPDMGGSAWRYGIRVGVGMSD